MSRPKNISDEEWKAKQRARNRQRSAELKDSYVAQTFGMPVGDLRQAPDDLIGCARDVLRLKQVIREKRDAEESKRKTPD